MRNAWHTVQSAALPYRWTRDGPQVLLVTSRTTRRWVIPKGSVKSGVSPCESAALEAFEEGGVRGRITRSSIGVYGYAKRDGKRGQFCLVQVFPLKVTSLQPRWPERAQRRRQWVSIADASGRVHEAALKRILLAFERQLMGSGPPSRVSEPSIPHGAPGAASGPRTRAPMAWNSAACFWAISNGAEGLRRRLPCR